MANKKSNNSKGKKGSKNKGKNNQSSKKIITALVIILVIILIVAIVLISVKGLWGDIIDFFKGLFGLEDEPEGERLIPDGTLEMRVLDIGQGDCILLLFPDGQVMVMDIGSELGTPSPWNVIDGALNELKITTIDYLFLSHTDYDHIREAKKLVDNYEIKSFYLPKADIDTSATWRNTFNACSSEKYYELDETTQEKVEKKAQINYNVGAYVIRGESWIMKCYSYDEAKYPTIKNSSGALDKNSVSPICLLEYADRTIVLTGDSNEKNEPYLLGKGYFDKVDADVLKVAHHGSRTSTMQEFLDKVDCEYAIISCGAKNDYGHPTKELLDRLYNYRDVRPDDDYDGFAEVYRTDEDGTITVQIDERSNISIVSEKNPDKNVATGTLDSDDSGNGAEITDSGQIVMFIIKHEIDYEELFVA